jgi:hypothetical protein
MTMCECGGSLVYRLDDTRLIGRCADCGAAVITQLWEDFPDDSEYRGARVYEYRAD